YLVAHVLRGDVAQLLEDEADGHEGHALARRALHGVEAVDRVDGFFEHLGDARFHLLDARALERRRGGDDREIDVRKQVEAEAPVAEQAEDDERPHEHAREHRAADEDVGDAHQAPGGASARTWTSVPSASFERPLVATCMPRETPWLTSTQPSPRSTPS